ncbi:hypothetical protein B0H17DRAFT_1133112 [Mycena rosella]|uniref:Uncharacterized protein n=1 Tax=Mycena rosella TaxID=1033263 RepID=A0AAD7GJS3_MYCRO|nr:hypothetical protein B0H17DRAFT_1133112 [Mycena rosella]
MTDQFTSIPTKYVVRPPLSAPCPVMLPVLLTNIIPEQFPFPRIFSDIDTSRTPTPPPAPHRASTPPPAHHCALTPSPRRAPTPAPRRVPTPAPSRRTPTPAPSRSAPTPDSRETSLTPLDEDDDSDSSFTANKSTLMAKPSAANIQTVKLLFKDLYPDRTKQEQENEYTAFRDRVDVLCGRYLRASLALSHQDKDEVNKVYTKMTETFPWIAHYENHWPVAYNLHTILVHCLHYILPLIPFFFFLLQDHVRPNRVLGARSGLRLTVVAVKTNQNPREERVPDFDAHQV